MTVLLEQIRPLLAAAEARVQTLREIERLALALDEAGGGTDDGPTPARHSSPGEWLDGVAPRPAIGATSAGVAVQPETGELLSVATAQTPPESAKTAPGSGPSENGHAPRTTTRRAEVLAFVQANGRVKNADVLAALGGNRTAIAQHLKHLVRDGLVDAEGNTTQRVYFTKEHGDQAAASRPHVAKTGVSKPLSQLRDDVLGVIRDARTGINEPDIADSIDLDREDVAVTCGELLDGGDVVLQPDGTYVTTSATGGGGTGDHRTRRPGRARRRGTRGRPHARRGDRPPARAPRPRHHERSARADAACAHRRRPPRRQDDPRSPDLAGGDGMTKTVYQHLCEEATARGLHVELWTDHRSKNARGPEEREPQITQLIITDRSRKTVFRAPTGVRQLDLTASRALAELPR